MSTSPSWFDKEKFSRLVKKVGPKGASDPAAAAPTGGATGPLAPLNGPGETVPAGEPIASTARISLVSKPTAILSEQRSLPALPRRTTPLPGLKALFQSPADTAPSAEMPAVITQPIPEISLAPAAKGDSEAAASDEAHEAGDPLAENADDLDGIWQKMALLNEELAQTIQERDHAMGDINQLRDQLRLTEEMLSKTKGSPSAEDLAQLIRERDNALSELDALKEKSATESGKIELPEGVTKTKELVFLTQERDQARKQYADLRKQYEGLKREQAAPSGPPPLPREDMSKLRKDLEQQIEGFRQKLEERNQEVAALKAAAAAAVLPPPLPSAGAGDSAEIEQLKAELAKAKEDASIAQRGLALSQKALQETRDALREATEGTSLSRHNFDNLKNECASLTQQNSVLQAQNEQLSRELAAVKQRKSGRLS